MSRSDRRREAKQAAAAIVRAGTSPHAARREMFGRIKRGVVGIVSSPADPRAVIVGARPPSGQAIRVQAGQPVPKLNLTLVGTGFVAEESIIVTARHVVEGMLAAIQQHGKSGGLGPPPAVPRILYMLPGSPKNGGVSWFYGMGDITNVILSNDHDIAACIAPHPTAPPFPDGERPAALATPLPLSSELCREGDEVVACGYPFGLQLHQDQIGGMVVNASFSRGIVSAELPLPGAHPRATHSFQMDAMINGGNSGGPVFDLHSGHVVGIVTSAFHINVQPQGGNGPGQPGIPTGLARAHHVHLIHNVIDQARQSLSAGRRRPTP